ncbi:transposase [Lysinibacillus sphaericus]
MCSWAGLVPGNNQSAGKRKSSKIMNGNKYLKSSLIEAAHSVRGSKNYLGALYRRTASRKGKKRAGIVVATPNLFVSFSRSHPHARLSALRCSLLRFLDLLAAKSKFDSLTY